MRNGDGAADDQRHVEGRDHFFALPAFFGAADQMIGDAVIAAQYCGGDQPGQFLVLGAERAGFVGLVVESKEALDAEVAAAECELSENLPGDRPWFLRKDILQRTSRAAIMDQPGPSS